MGSDLEQRDIFKNLLTGGPINLLKKKAEKSGTKNPMHDEKQEEGSQEVMSLSSSTIQ